MKRWIRFSGKLLFILILVGLLFSYAMFQGGFVSWFLFFSFLPVFLYHFGLLFYAIHRWQVKRALSGHIVRSGEGITVTVTIKRAIPYPLFYCVMEELYPDSLHKWDIGTDKYSQLGHPEKFRWNRTMRRMVFPGWKRHITITYALDGLPRGEHAFRAIRLTTGDWFGFVQKTHVFPTSDQLVVQPNLLSADTWELQSSIEHGPIAANVWNSKNTNVATGIREYLPGDKFTWIDWKQTARRNTMMTKEFDQEKSNDTCIVLDSCSGAGSYELAFEATIELSLSLVAGVKRQASKSRFLTIADTVTYFDVYKNTSEIDRLRQHLTRLRPEGVVSFAAMLNKAVQQMPGTSLIILITTRLDKALYETVQPLRKRSKNIMIYLVQPTDFITNQTANLIRQLRFNGVIVHVLTEKQLTRHTTRGDCG